MNCTCPHCQTVYRLDPAKVPEEGVRARCARCTGVFAVPGRGGSAAASQPAQSAGVQVQGAEAGERVSAVGEPVAAPRAPAAGSFSAPSFGAPDPHGKARRLARALISDIVVYHPERRDRSLREGTLRQEFREEIRKSWDEYVAQVGEETARSTPFFREALNEILAGGAQTF